MKKIAAFILLATASLIVLAACGNKYDDDIDQVIKKENKQLDKPSTETDINQLKRKDTQIWVYDDGKYIKLKYVIRGKEATADPVYIYDKQKDEYVSEYDDDNFSDDDIKGKKPDYTENVDDDDD